jgi:hypothetical protein
MHGVKLIHNCFTRSNDSVPKLNSCLPLWRVFLRLHPGLGLGFWLGHRQPKQPPILGAVSAASIIALNSVSG